jgi:hypothetical protein
VREDKGRGEGLGAARWRGGDQSDRKLEELAGGSMECTDVCACARAIQTLWDSCAQK